MNPNYTEFKFPQIKAHPWHKVEENNLMLDCLFFILGLKPNVAFLFFFFTTRSSIKECLLKQSISSPGFCSIHHTSGPLLWVLSLHYLSQHHFFEKVLVLGITVVLHFSNYFIIQTCTALPSTSSYWLCISLFAITVGSIDPSLLRWTPWSKHPLTERPFPSSSLQLQAPW